MSTFEYRQMTRDQQLQYLVEQRAKFDIFTGPTADVMRKQYDERIARTKKLKMREELIEIFRLRKTEMALEFVRDGHATIDCHSIYVDNADPTLIHMEFQIRVLG
jgi:hypothetical protein